MPEDSSSAAKNGRGKDKRKRSRREFSMEEIEKRRKGCERREALKDAEDQREIELLDDRDPDQLRRKKQLMKKAQAKARKRNQRERRRINLPSVPFSSAASSSSIDLDLYRPEALSDEENVFVLQPDDNLWLTPGKNL